jgi:parallel beta-helix repeat protein
MSKARELSKLPNYVLSTVAELKLAVGKEQGDKAFIGGYYTDGDGGGGDFYWDAVSVEADNGGTIFQVTGTTTGRWKRIYSGSVSVKWFGAKGDGVVDDTVALSNAFSWLSASNYRKLIGNTNDSYLCKQTLPITSSAGIFDGNGCIFYHAVTSNNPLFIFNNTSQSPFELRNFTVFGSGTVGNVISIFGALAGSPSFLTIDNVKVNSVIGTGKNSTGTSVPSCFVWCENSMTIRITNCTIYNSSGGIYFTNTQKILISNTTIDTILTGRHLYLNGCRHIVINGRSIINGGTNSGQCEFIGNTSLSVTETRFKSGNGYAISATGQNNSLTISRCNFEVYECTSSSVLVTTSASGVNLYSNYFTLINSGASTIFTQAVIDIIDESGGGYISLSGKIESNKIIVNNGLTLNAGIRLNSSLNSLRGWSVNNNIIGNVATSSIITNGILLLGTQQSTEVLNNGFNHQGSGSYVVTGLSIGSSCSGTKVSGLSSSGITNSLIVDSGIHTIREQLGVWEAGTFTPVIYGGTVEGTGTYTMQNGKYSKIGNLVFINIALTITAHTGSGEFRIRGLPFPSFSLSSQLQSMNIVTSGVTFSNQIVCYPSQGTSFIRLSQLVTNSAMTNVQLSTSCTVYITGVYEIA